MSRSPSFSMKSELPSSTIDPESLQKWVAAFCIIRFDLEQGQLIEDCYPSGCLSQEEEIEVAFSSFPDSVSQHHNRSSIHDCIFFFRFRRRGVAQHQLKLPSSEITELDEEDKPSPQRSVRYNSGRRFLYGFVFNRQRHDEKLRRGGEQKSVVILSYSPYSSVFKPLLQIMGPLYFDIGKKSLEHIAACISKWPNPVPGKLMELPIGNASLKVNLPPSHSLPLDEDGINIFEESNSAMAPFLPNNQSVPQGLFHDSDIFAIFRGVLLQLWMLWELVLIGEPILVISPTAPQCCEAVTSLVSLVAPLLCSVDFRPYFTIHDPEFKRLNSLREGDSFPSMVLGVTNLFFLKSLKHIPHVLSVGNPSMNSSRVSVSNVPLKRFSPAGFLNAVKMRRDGPLCLMTEHREAIWSSYNATTKPDTSILNRLIDAGLSPRVEESMSVVNNEILRRHFLELTTNFLAPFGPYFRATTPSAGSSPFVDPPPLPPFKVDEFVASLSARGPGKFLSKRMRSNWLELYRRFLNGQNFMPWFSRRRAVAEKEQLRLWRQARMVSDITLVMSRMSELEVVDLFNAIERFILEETILGKTCEKFKSDLLAVFNVIPEDVQQLLVLNPQRAALLNVEAS
ncbi:protein DENND6A [Impatiens glandulifera]|uniref:protein DENND6A n=1 Tax=Impatiens glandulifera TaxID=253017 RepID=UPI001FB07718|nr:protein DENND6A [Impatiens glandulifera]